jgi:hypothetical protein
VTAPNFQYRDANWTSDGQHLVIYASESNHAMRFWIQPISGGSPKAITPESIDGIFVTLNHDDYIAVRDDSGALRLFPLDGSAPKTVAYLEGSERLIGAAPNSEFLYVTSNDGQIPIRVFKLSTKTGARQFFVSLAPKDVTGVVSIATPIFTSDEKQYVYSYTRAFSALYLAKGLK